MNSAPPGVFVVWGLVRLFPFSPPPPLTFPLGGLFEAGQFCTWFHKNTAAPFKQRVAHDLLEVLPKVSGRHVLSMAFMFGLYERPRVSNLA
jgi:hypothetical protein